MLNESISLCPVEQSPENSSILLKSTTHCIRTTHQKEFFSLSQHTVSPPSIFFLLHKWDFKVGTKPIQIHIKTLQVSKLTAIGLVMSAWMTGSPLSLCWTNDRSQGCVSKILSERLCSASSTLARQSLLHISRCHSNNTKRLQKVNLLFKLAYLYCK